MLFAVTVLPINTFPVIVPVEVILLEVNSVVLTLLAVTFPVTVMLED